MPPASNALVDYLAPERTRTRDALWVVAFGLLTALMAQIRIPLPFTPVPITGQTLAVLLSGAVLGSRRGFCSQALYLAAGVAGLPVFAGGAATFGQMLGPTGGYLWSYPVAAGLLGWLVERGAARKTWRLALALALSDGLILSTGTAWLHAAFKFPYAQALLLGFYPFLVGDVLKIALVGCLLPRLLRRYEQSGSCRHD